MTPLRKKSLIGLWLTVTFVFVLATGIILHLKKHGILIEPRQTLKLTHWILGCIIGFLCYWHWRQFSKILAAMKIHLRWFWTDTVAIIAFTILTFVSGFVKLFSPIKIPNLGLWHYSFGIIMALFIAIHLVRGFPVFLRQIRKK